MPIRRDEDDTRWRILFEGDVDITSAVELKSMLVEGISYPGDLQLDFTRVTDFDVVVLQLFLAAAREAETMDKSLVIVGQTSEDIKSSVRLAGFDNFPIPLAPKHQHADLANRAGERVDDQ